jgi:hypothetical protein
MQLDEVDGWGGGGGGGGGGKDAEALINFFKKIEGFAPAFTTENRFISNKKHTAFRLLSVQVKAVKRSARGTLRGKCVIY